MTPQGVFITVNSEDIVADTPPIDALTNDVVINSNDVDVNDDYDAL